jgi:hypothetical protein
VSTGSTSSPSSATTPSGPGIGQIAKDGDFAFVVHSMTCGRAIAVEVGGVPAGATECLLTMSVTADKAQGQTFEADAQYAYDTKGRKYSADDTGLLALPNSNDLTQVNPGITITAQVPFQVPVGDPLVTVELHDSLFSGGVDVSLTKK